MSKFVDHAFLDRDASATSAFYDEWAEFYDADVAAMGYAAPARSAAALALHETNMDTPILDFGCGTGLAGAALKAAGFSRIDGVDIAPAMLEKARAKGIYNDIAYIAPDTAPAGAYGIISAVGVIGLGAAPGTTLDLLMHALPKGGKLVFSFNDHALADPMQTGRLNEWIDCSAARLLFAEHGPHLPTQQMNSTIYVVEKY